MRFLKNGGGRASKREVLHQSAKEYDWQPMRGRKEMTQQNETGNLFKVYKVKWNPKKLRYNLVIIQSEISGYQEVPSTNQSISLGSSKQGPKHHSSLLQDKERRLVKQPLLWRLHFRNTASNHYIKAIKTKRNLSKAT